MSTKRSSTTQRRLSPSIFDDFNPQPSPRIAPDKQVKLNIPGSVIDTANKIWEFLWNKSCPFGSMYIWIMIGLAFYYMFWLPDLTLNYNQYDGTLVTKKINKTLRGYLVLSVVISTGVGYYIIRKGCVNAGPGWAVLWFFVALIMATIITQIILALTENITIPGAVDLLRQVTKTTP